MKSRASRLNEDLLRKVLLVPESSDEREHPTSASVFLAEDIIRQTDAQEMLPDSVCVPDDGDITFSWRPVRQGGVGDWLGTLTVSPTCEIEGVVQIRSMNTVDEGFVEQADESTPFQIPTSFISAISRRLDARGTPRG